MLFCLLSPIIWSIPLSTPLYVSPMMKACILEHSYLLPDNLFWQPISYVTMCVCVCVCLCVCVCVCLLTLLFLVGLIAQCSGLSIQDLGLCAVSIWLLACRPSYDVRSRRSNTECVQEVFPCDVPFSVLRTMVGGCGRLNWCWSSLGV